MGLTLLGKCCCKCWCGTNREFCDVTLSSSGL